MNKNKYLTINIVAMEFRKLFIGLFLSFLFQFAYANDNSDTDENLLNELQIELQEVINWECSADNPSLGKFINLKCNLLSTGD